MGKTSTEAKNRYNAKAYDRLSIAFKKGKLSTYKEHAAKRGMSLTALIQHLLEEDMKQD